MNKIFYWSPFTSKVATIKAVMNSIYGVKKYLNHKFEPFIIDAVNEWDEFEDELNKKNIKIIKLNKKTIFNNFNKVGFFRSRIAYLYIFFKAFYPLHVLLKKKKPTFIIIHLITSLPLILFLFKNYQTKLILRISGLPKMTFFRRLLWKLVINKVYKITCPTKDTYNDLSKFDLFKNKLTVLKDPIIHTADIQKTKLMKTGITKDIEKILSQNDFFLSIGRFTKQKNFIFYLNCIPKILKLQKNLYFLFIGQGEDEKLFIETAKKLKILHRIIRIRSTKNVHYFMNKSKAFVLTSLWEDPGFVLIEAGYNNCSVISSDCPNGPVEIINNNGGYLYSSNNEDSFLKVVSQFFEDSEDTKFIKKVKLKKRVKYFTPYQHSLSLNNILN
jgi:glycosyltransferase involved in cell wall biosynthesis